MKRHSLLGCDIVEAAEHARRGALGAPPPRALRRRGYPDGLAGDEIPLESRIILVADAFEAMTSEPARTARRRALEFRRRARRPRDAVRPGRRRRAMRALDREARSGGLGAVALLELLARAAPARVVAPELLVLVDAALLDHG